MDHGSGDPGLTPGTMVGEYQIERLVGEGGMGQVYGAVHPVIGKRAAIKVLLPDICRNRQMVERFLLEARSVNQIGHPNIVDVFAFGVLPDGRQYMVMEWLRGEALSDYLRRGVPPLGDTCDILLGVAAALEAAHDKGIIHRDLKPHNVFLVELKGSKPLVKLLDFGLVKLTGPEDDGRVERTRAGSIMGTPAYMSPEQALGRSVDTRSDIYSFGVMAFQMLTGQLPFLDDNAMALIVAHMQQPPTRPSAVAPNIPPELDQLVLALLAKDAAQRPSLEKTREVLTYVRDYYGTGHRSGSLPPRPSLPVVTPGVHTTLGNSTGEKVLTAHNVPAPGPAPRKSRTLLFGIIGALVVAGIVVAAVVGAGGGSGTPAAGPGSQQAATPLDAGAVDSAPIATTSVDAAAVAATPEDASVAADPVDAAVVATPDAAVTKPTKTGRKPPRTKTTTTTPTKTDTSTNTTRTPPPPEDDDGLLQVTPKKK